MTTTENPVRNGVDTATLFATLDAVKGNPDIAKFQFRATNRWVSGTHNQSTIHGFHGALQEMTHQQPWTFDADHPAVLVGNDNGPTPVEYLLHAIAACLTAGIANRDGGRLDGRSGRGDRGPLAARGRTRRDTPRTPERGGEPRARSCRGGRRGAPRARARRVAARREASGAVRRAFPGSEPGVVA